MWENKKYYMVIVKNIFSKNPFNKVNITNTSTPIGIASFQGDRYFYRGNKYLHTIVGFFQKNK